MRESRWSNVRFFLTAAITRHHGTNPSSEFTPAAFDARKSRKDARACQSEARYFPLRRGSSSGTHCSTGALRSAARRASHLCGVGKVSTFVQRDRGGGIRDE